MVSKYLTHIFLGGHKGISLTFRVSDVRFDPSNEERVPCGVAGQEHVSDTLQLDRVADCSARACDKGQPTRRPRGNRVVCWKTLC